MVPPDARLGLVADSRSVPLLDLYAPVRFTMDRGATKDASHDDPDRCQSADKPAPARGMKPEEGNLAATLFDAVILSRAIPNTAV